MPHGVAPSMSRTDLASAVRDGDWPQARRAMAIRLAEAFDQTDSARDLKAITMSLSPLIEACEMDDRQRAERAETPLSSIMAEADEQGY